MTGRAHGVPPWALFSFLVPASKGVTEGGGAYRANAENVPSSIVYSTDFAIRLRRHSDEKVVSCLVHNVGTGHYPANGAAYLTLPGGH